MEVGGTTYFPGPGSPLPLALGPFNSIWGPAGEAWPWPQVHTTAASAAATPCRTHARHQLPWACRPPCAQYPGLHALTARC
jgi:hypothetical protein